MAYPAYSTEAQLRANHKRLTAASLPTSDAENRIDAADRKVRADLANIIDFSLVTIAATDSNFPEFLNLAAQYKAVELALVYLYGAIRRANEQGDIDYWKDEYNKIVEEIYSGKYTLELGDGTSIAGGTSLAYSQDAKPNIAPALGEGEFLEYQDYDDLEEGRPLDDDDDDE